MSVTVVGSIAFDAVKTPWGRRDRLLGGSAVHFALSASFLAEVRVVGPVGDDFGEAEYDVLRARGVNVDDIEHVQGGKTFFWSGEYEYDLNTRHTHDTQLNVFADFAPKLSDASKTADVVFLANIQPDLQREVREQCAGARVVGLDSMNLWIETARNSLVRTIERVDVLVVNDAELRQLTEKPNLLQAAREVMDWGPTAVVVKQGEYGASLYSGDRFFSLPAYPLESVLDPTGAGDSFAGGLFGYIAAHPDEGLDEELLRRAMAYGTALASFNVEEFGTERVQRLTADEVRERVGALHACTNWVDVPLEQRA
ncbi:MAG TPA: PfkB family carbohydrate kinase [Solirubrobacteraceae bacterium]|jgi:sugar/nucleoside kinase (ribokinase family)|nr:PfkB family carbohydrate kinase [Solirubrobacteraceae bacterium]